MKLNLGEQWISIAGYFMLWQEIRVKIILGSLPQIGLMEQNRIISVCAPIIALLNPRHIYIQTGRCIAPGKQYTIV